MVKTRVPAWLAVLLAVLALLVYSNRDGKTIQGAGFIPAKVVNIVDGDTIHVRLPGGQEERVRFIGVNTPESQGKVEPYGKEAAAYTQRRLSGRTVYLELDVGERDKYGRLLAYVWLEP
ncbi:MAG: thermonuclease family protein, partial [Moorellaceae bacterium]